MGTQTLLSASGLDSFTFSQALTSISEIKMCAPQDQVEIKEAQFINEKNPTERKGRGGEPVAPVFFCESDVPE